MASANRTSESGIDWDLEYHLSTFGVSFEDEDDMSQFYDSDNFDYLQNDFSQMSLDSEENPIEETFRDAQMSLDRALELSRQNTTTTPTENVSQQPQQLVSGNYRGTVVDLRSGTSNTIQPPIVGNIISNPSAIAERNEQQGSHQRSWQDPQQYFDTRRPSNQEISSARLGSTNEASGIISTTMNTSNVRAPPTSSRPVASDRKIPIAKGPMTITKDLVTIIQEKRKRAVEGLPLEPNENDENVICIAILLPSGQRVKRRFLKTDSLSVLKAFIWSHKKVPDKFEVSTNYPRRILNCTPSITFEEAGITSNELLYVTSMPSST